MQNKRTPDKIKDIIEPQAFDEVQNYVGNPERTLAAYFFTDATSDLLVRWLDSLANLTRQSGTARALAGLRGVGKSHTLAVFGALAGFPDLRTRVSDAHVGTSARRLLNRRYVVAHVERGTRETLADEFRVALARSFGGDEKEWMGEPAALLAIAASRSDAPLVVICDTAYGREARVQRDDGPFLSQLAEATQSVNAFIALALDDDIAGADGANVQLSKTFQIDYLDPEHLYRVADQHLFRKAPQVRSVLHEIYMHLRASVTGFNWSEPRFAALYPLHPLIADVAPAVRLYAPTFALLPFAASIVPRSLGHPSSSLILLDEVFDRAEQELRKAEDLREAFGAYDEVAAQAISQLPIMQRLHAKLILKGLFILSLDGRGATAAELCAAMLLMNGAGGTTSSVVTTEEILARFALAAPAGLIERNEEQTDARYRFKISASLSLGDALAASVQGLTIDNRAIHALLSEAARARFEDWPFSKEMTEGATAATDFMLMWRGMGRRGQIIWRELSGDASSFAQAPINNEPASDWQVVTLAPHLEPVHQQSPPAPVLKEPAQSASVQIVWRPACPTDEELESLRRLLALRTDAELLSQFGETARAAERTHAALAERIWSRLYIDDAVLQTSNGESVFPDEARAARTLSAALAQVFHTSLAARFPQHPDFSETLGQNEVAQLVGGLFGGANQGEAGVQQLARLFAEPLGLVSLRGGVYALEAGDQALKQPWVREVLAMTDAAGGGVVPIEDVYRRLKSRPFGLLREAQHLILAALVAQRRIELITASGDRISRRTLDQKLRWDEIAGIARAAALLHSAEELTNWSRLLTNQTKLASIAEPEAREAVREALRTWVKAWRGESLLERFDALPDEGLTTTVWKLAVTVRKSFGAAADAIEVALADTISLEEGLQRVADAFGDSVEQFTRNRVQLAQLKNFTDRLCERERAHTYLLLADLTGLEIIESARRELLTIAEDVHHLLDEESNRRFDLLWQGFQSRYIEHYVATHERASGMQGERQTLEALLRSHKWREFETLSALSVVNQSYWTEAERLLSHASESRCELPARQLLQERPSCGCAFRLTRAFGSITELTQSLEDLARRGLEAHRRVLYVWSKHLGHALEELAQQEIEIEARAHAATLAAIFSEGSIPQPFTPFDVQLIELALQRTAVPPLRVSFPRESYGLMTSGELGARLKEWLDELPNNPALVDVVSESGHDGV